MPAPEDAPADARPPTVPFGDAVARVLALAELHTPVAVVGVTGPAAAGKSLLASRLSSCVVRTDDYLPDYETLEEHERDHPKHADLKLLAEHLRELREGRAVEGPTWSFHAHRREGTRTIEPARVVVCEGIHALHPPAGDVLDVRVYVDASSDARRARWTAIERSGDRGWGVEKAMRYMERVADPTFELFAQEYRRLADVLVINDESH